MRKLAKVLIVLVFAIAIIAAVTSCGCDHENIEVQGKKAVTCTKDGYTGDKVCVDCDEVIEDGEPIPKTGHKYDAGVVTKEATCISQGTLTKTCTVCKETKNEAIPTVAHQEIFHDVLDGTHNITCLICTAHNEYKSHNPKDAGTPVAATCTESAYTLMTCVDCGASYKKYASGAEPLGHSFGAWENTTVATCSTNGVKTRYCARCDEFETIEITANASAHDWNAGVQLVAPTCVEEGIRVLSCNNCSASKEVAIPKCAHSYVDESSDGSGWVSQSCEFEGCVATRTYFDASTLKQADIAIDTIPEGEDLELGMENATIAIPKDVIDQIKGSSASDVTIKAEFVDDSAKDSLLDKMSAEEKARLEGESIYDFGISGVSSFNAAVTVTIPYVLKDGEDAEGILIWYVKENGEIEEVSATYNATTETVTFSVEHFSFYAVAYQETQAMKCRRGVHDFVKTDITFAATCEYFGYTVYECTHCHLHDIGDIVEKRDHAWGELKQPTVTCTEGGYTYRECSKCGAHLESTYVRAEGHNVTTNPTCAEGAKCTKCNETVKPALGHSFSDWTVKTPATATTEGLKERSCLTCGTKESVKIAKLGSVEPVEFETLEDMYSFVFGDLLGIPAGSFNFDLSLYGNMNVKGSLSFASEPFAFSMWADATESLSDGTKRTYTVGAYYDGKSVYIYDDGELMITDLVAMMESSGAELDEMKEIFTALYDYVNPEVEKLVKLAKDILKVLPEDVSSTLKTYVDSIETTYAYYSLLLGFDTNLAMVNDVKPITAQDIAVVFDALMTKTEANGNVTYTLTAKNLTDEIDKAIKYIEDNLNKPMGDLFFENNKEVINKTYPDVKSFAELIAKLKAEFPGTLTLNKALEKLLKIAISQNMTLADVYEVIDLVLAYAGMTDESGKPISSKEMLDKELQQMTLNQVLEMMMSSMGGGNGDYSEPDYGDDYYEPGYGESSKPIAKPMNATAEETVTVEAILDMLAEMLNSMTLGATEIPDAGATVADMLPMIKEYYSMIKPTLNVEIKLNAEGNITSANVGFNATMVNPETKEEAELASGTVTFTASAKVTAPDAIKDSIATINLTTKTEANGDITVSGIPADFTTNFELSSSYYASFKKLIELGYLTKDAELTAQYGTTVYKLDEKFSGRRNWLGDYYYIDGKYYTSEGYNFSIPGEIIEKVNVSDFLANPENYLPKEGDEPAGFIRRDYEESTPIYLTVGGIVYEEGGEWYVINADRSNLGYTYDYSSDDKESIVLYVDEYNLVSAPYSDFFASIDIDSIKGANYKYSYAFEHYYGVEFYNNVLCIALANNLNPEYADWGVSAYTFGVIENDEIFFVRGSRGISEYRNSVGHEVEIPEGYEKNEYTYKTEVYHNGVLVEVDRVEFYKPLPEYYVAVTDEVFVNVEEGGLVMASLTGSNGTAALPDGKTMYVKGYDGPYTYGYVQVAGNLCAQAALNNETGEVLYRYGSTEKYMSVSSLVDLDEGIIFNANGSITVKKDLIDKINSIVSGDENGYVLYVGAEKKFDEDATVESIEIMYPVIYSAPKMDTDELIEDMLGSMNGGYSPDYYTDWYSWFGSSYGVNVVPNGDGTVSFYYSDGGEIYFDLQNYDSFPVDEIAQKNEELSASLGLPIYSLTQLESYHPTFVKIGNSYYHWNTYSDHDVTYYSSAADIKASRFAIRELTLFIPAANPDDDVDVNVYLGTVYIEGLTNSIDFYFVIEDGYLYVLTGAERISEFGIKFEGKMKASEYFSKLKINVNTSNYWHYDTTFVNGAKKQIYYVNAEVIEPASVNGVEDRYISSNSVRAVKNGSFFNYIKTYEYNNVYILEVNEKATIPESYKLYSQHTESYTNGTFTFVTFEEVYETVSNFIQIGGKFYNYHTDWSYSEENFKESFYEKKTLYVGTRYDGSTVLLEGDIYGSLTPYEGELKIADADKVYNMGWGTGEYTNLVEYVFYLYDGTEDQPIFIGDLNGNTVYAKENGKEAFVKVNDRYFRGNLIQTEKTANVVEINGMRYYFDPYDYSDARVSSEALEASDAFKEIVKYEMNGSVITVSEEIFEFFNSGDFEIYIHGSGNSDWINRDELLAMFDRAGNLEGGKNDGPYFDYEYGDKFNGSGNIVIKPVN